MTATAKSAYKYRAYPTTRQVEWLASTFGMTRVVYNDYLWQKEQAYKAGLKTHKPRDLSGKTDSLPPDLAWLAEASNKLRQQARRDAEAAYRNFFASLTGARKGPRVGRPRYRRKKEGGSLRWNGVGTLFVRVYSKKWAAVRLPKGPKGNEWLRFRLSRPMPSKPTGVTLRLLPSGEYTVSFSVEESLPEPKTDGSVAAYDAGLVDLAAVVTTAGVGERYKITAPRSYRRAERRLKAAQREYARKQKGSKNQGKARQRVAKLHARVARQRKDYSAKVAHKLARDNQAVCVESLFVEGMKRNKRLAKSVSDAGLARLKAQVEWACRKAGTAFLPIDRWAPTSQVCSVCGCLDGPKDLGIRVWQCQECEALLDRDWNAALNVLLAAGQAERLNACGGDVRRRLACAVPREAGTPAHAASAA